MGGNADATAAGRALLAAADVLAGRAGGNGGGGGGGLGSGPLGSRLQGALANQVKETTSNVGAWLLGQMREARVYAMHVG